MSTTVKITETYDLKTSVNKMGIIGIHTPSFTQIKRMYGGLMKNHKFLRINSCDIVGACASVLPADPLSVGTTAGEVAPEDMFNPILYKAVSNEAFDTLVNRIYGATDIATLGSVNKEDISVDAFDMYYSLLAEHGRWVHSMPQQGFALRGLYPLCYHVINTYGNMHPPVEHFIVDDVSSEPSSEVRVPDLNGVNVTDVDANGRLTGVKEQFLATTFKGESVRMPRIPIHYRTESVGDMPVDFTIPKTFVACIIVPPAKLHEFYYRMRVTWTVTFEDVCSSLEVASTVAMKAVTAYTYANEYASAKSSLPNNSDTVDTTEVSINKIMES